MRYLIAAAVLGLAGSSFAETINVPSDHDTIQGAINASSNGDTIAIAADTYYEHSLNPNGKAITIQGTLNGDGSLVTTINAQHGGSVFVIQMGETSGTVIKDLVITGGNGTDLGWGNAGGGILCNNNSNPTISNCTISGNTAYFGGGIYCNYDSNPAVTNCEISNNTATYNGGGIHCDNGSHPTISNCMIEDNTADYGGGLFCYNNSSPTLIGCTISNNTATYNGGGIYCNYGSNPAISNCMILTNSANGNGGGIACDTNSNPTITTCIIPGNTSTNGGGIYCRNNSNPTITTGCLIFSNVASSEGGGVYCENSSPVHSSCTFSYNSPDNVYGDSDWNPLGRGGAPSIITIENCTIFGTGEHIAGNIPILHLGENHIHDGIDDGDLDGDGDVDVDDLNLHHAAVGICQSDVNHDGVTDIEDLLIMIEGWNAVCP